MDACTRMEYGMITAAQCVIGDQVRLIIALIWQIRIGAWLHRTPYCYQPMMLLVSIITFIATLSKVLLWAIIRSAAAAACATRAAWEDSPCRT